MRQWGEKEESKVQFAPFERWEDTFIRYDDSRESTKEDDVADAIG